MFVEAPKVGQCWICRSSANQSREHKIKASDLRRLFGREELFIGQSDIDRPQGKIAQGVNSTHLKFENPICAKCNSSTTQESDRAYDRLIEEIEQGGTQVEEIYQIFSDP